MRARLLLCLLPLAMTAHAAPQGQVMGPAWNGEKVTLVGTVIAEDGPCRQIAVDADGWSGTNGRAWGCFENPALAPALNTHTSFHGRVTTTRLTRMGPAWRVVPVLEGL